MILASKEKNEKIVQELIDISCTIRQSFFSEE